MLAVKFVQLVDGGVEISLIAVGVAEIVADRGLAGSDALGFAIFVGSLRQIALFMQRQAEIGVSLPKCGAQMNGLLIVGDGARHVPGGVLGDTHIVISVGVAGIAGERLFIGVHRGFILVVRIERQAQVLIGHSVFGIDAERGASFADGVGPVVEAIKKISQGAVILGQIGHEARGLGKFVEGIVPLLLVAEHDAESEVQRGIVAVIMPDSGKRVAQVKLGFVIVAGAGFACAFQEGWRNRRADLG